MADASYAVSGFHGGEISQFAQGRFDRPDYKISLNVCLNAFPAEIGPWVRRPGTAFAGATRGGVTGRVMGWSFQQAAPYTVEYTNGFARFRSGINWATNNDGQIVSSITTANPAVVTVTTSPATGATVIFTKLGTTCPLLQNRQFTWTHISSTTGSIADALTGANIDGSTLGVGSLATTATMSTIQELTTPYTSNSWSSLRAVQAETNAFLLNGMFAPQQLSVTTPPAGVNSAIFAINPASLLDGPYLDPPTTGVQVTPNQTTGVVQLAVSFPAYVSTTAYAKGSFVTSASVNYESLIDQNIGNTPSSSPSDWLAVPAAAAINNGQGFLATDIGRLVRLYSEPQLWTAAGTYSVGNVVSYNPTGSPGASTYWQSLVGSNTGNVPGSDLTHWELVAPGAALPSINGITNPAAASGPAQWTWGKIVSLVNFIAGNVAGVAHIGTMTANGGLAASFNGITGQVGANSSALTGTGSSGTAYVGQNYTGTSATAYAIASATVFPSSDEGLFFASTLSSQFGAVVSLTAYLYGSNSAPSSYNNGTLLGTTNLGNFSINSSPLGPVACQLAPFSIPSNNTTTTYAYVWVAFSMTIVAGFNSASFTWLSAQVEFVNAAGTGSSSNGINVELLGPPLLYTQPIVTWRLGLYSNTTGWPTCGCYAGGRLWLAGAVANRFDACVSNGISGVNVNFAPTDQYGGVNANNAISYTLNSDGVNPIQWLKPILQGTALRGIIIGTQQREWFIFPPAGGGFSPNNIDANSPTEIGGANVLPCKTEHTDVFVHRYAVKLMEYFADVFSGKFTAPNLADKAQHITRASIAELAYQKATTPLIWGRCNDGSLFGITYKRDTLMTSQGPTFYAWHRHAPGSGRVVESLCAGPSVGGALDALTLVTNQTSASAPDANVRHVEVLTDQLDELATLAQQWLLDDAVNPSSATSSSTPVTYSAWAAGTTYAQGNTVTYTDGNVYVSLVNSNTGNIPPNTLGTDWLLGGSAPYGGMTINGLWHLNGKVATVFAAGLDCGDYLILNGSCFVPFGDGISAGTGYGQFISSFATTALAANQIVVGLTYNSDGQLVRAIEPQMAGTRNGPALGKERRNHKVAFLVNNLGMANVSGQSALSFGTDFTKLKPALIGLDTVKKMKWPMPPNTYSGVWRDSLGDESGYDGMVCWRISRPLPCNVVAIEPFLETQDQ